MTQYLNNLKEYLFCRNFQLTQHSNISYGYASIIVIVFYAQHFILYSLPKYNPIINAEFSSDIYAIIEGTAKLFLLKFDDIDPNKTSNNSISSIVIIIGLIICQLLVLMCFLFPIEKK